MRLQHRVLTKQRTNKVHYAMRHCKFQTAKVQNNTIRKNGHHK